MLALCYASAIEIPRDRWQHLFCKMWGQMCGSEALRCSFMMHLSCNLSLSVFLSLYRIYVVTKGSSTLMHPLVPSLLNILLSLISCHMPAVVLAALVLALKKWENPVRPELREQVKGCLLAVCRLSLAWGSPGQDTVAVPQRATETSSSAAPSQKCHG